MGIIPCCTVSGVGIALIIGLHGNVRMAKILADERNDMPMSTISQCMNSNLEESMNALSEATSEERGSKSDRGLAPQDNEKTGHLVQTRSQILIESGVQAPSVQLGDLCDLEDYLYQPKTEVADDMRWETNEKESTLPEHTCWCIQASGSKLEPLLKMVHKHFRMLELWPLPYNDEWCFDPDLEVADKECWEIRNSLDEAALRYAIRQGYWEFVDNRIARQRSVGWDRLQLAIMCDQMEVARVFVASTKLNDHLKHRGLEEAAY